LIEALSIKGAAVMTRKSPPVKKKGPKRPGRYEIMVLRPPIPFRLLMPSLSAMGI
jgi:hypothetical protein